MKNYSKHIAAIIMLSLLPLAGQAQLPRVQTSAPAEKTAVPVKGGTSSGKPAAQSTKPAKSSAKASENKTNKKAPKASTPTQALTDRYMAIKSNLAYDAVAILNLAYEVQLSQKFSLEIPVMWSLWDWEADNGVRTVTLQPGVKYHFGEQGSGHAVGADLGIGWFNMRHNKKRYQDTGRPMMGVSLNYSYTLPLGKRWAAEFSVGVGYVNMSYNTYYNIENGAKISKNERNYVGPTRIGISLSYKL